MLDKQGDLMLENTLHDFPYFPIELADLYLAVHHYHLKTEIVGNRNNILHLQEIAFRSQGTVVDIQRD